MYNDELKLAVEYNGVQHYKFSRFFHKTNEDFEKLQEHDIIKKDLCEKKGVNLIVIKYTETDIKKFLTNELKKLEIKIIPEKDQEKIILKNEIIEKLDDILKEKGGTYISGDKSVSENKCKFMCENNHIFETKIKYITQAGSWCGICAIIKNSESVERKNKISESMKTFFKSEIGTKIGLEARRKVADIKNKLKSEIREHINNGIIKTKKCTGILCKTSGNDILDISCFGPKKDAKDGLQPYCKNCQREAKRLYKLNKKMNSHN